MRIKGFFAVPLSAALLIFGGCAQQAALTGGPRDSTPPRMLRSLPDAEAVGVTSPVIRLTFDEYFTLNSPRDSIRITPAQKNPPDFVQKGKSLVITLKDSLIPNTTYHIDFANGVIRDLTENNPMSASSLVFSTGNAVDSFSLHGVALDAQTLQPVANACVLLFINPDDSCPLRDAADFFTLTDKNGGFAFRHIPQDSYRIYALADKNFNRRFDQTDEMFAFMPENSPVSPVRIKTDIDTTSKPDSIARADSSADEGVRLLLFRERPEKTRLLRNSSTEKGIHRFAFNIPTDTFRLQSLRNVTPGHLTERTATGDTVIVYFYDSTRNREETFLLQHDGGTDTVTLNPCGGGGKERDTVRKPLEHRENNKVEIGEKFTIRFHFPLRSADTAAFTLYEIRRKESDTLKVEKFGILRDPELPRQLQLDYPLRSRCDYLLIVADSSCVAWNGQYNDSLKLAFTVKGKKEYGQLQLSLLLPDKRDYLLQLTDTKYNVRYEQNVPAASVTGDTLRITFPHLKEGDYRLRVIADGNGNGVWDTGKYITHQEPEQVFINPKTWTIKTNWTIEETIEVIFK
ncbi:MAG: Ig-like domain-containing protein [Bacteroidales bacterium]|nr:Ig-like domain-containing protein [Bacteroidales bacterium]